MKIRQRDQHRDDISDGLMDHRIGIRSDGDLLPPVCQLSADEQPGAVAAIRGTHSASPVDSSIAAKEVVSAGI